jgi:signal transduction histidine kinase
MLGDDPGIDPASTPLSVLLVEDNPVHADLIRRYLSDLGQDVVRLSHAPQLSDALRALSLKTVDALLLDLSLPDSRIEETLPQVIGHHGELPIIVLTSLNDLEFGARAVQQGAQDYLVKTDLGGQLLLRSIRYAIERKKTQDKLESYAADLERSNEQLKTFAHTLAHEVKSPLSVVVSCLQMLEAKYGTAFDGETQELVHDATRSVQGLSELVNELLEFARVGSEDDEFGSVDMESLFYHVYAMLRPIIRHAGASLTHDPLPTVHGNEIQLRQLLQNLISNAIKYRGPNRPAIHISAGEDMDRWVFSIKDNGLGIAPDLQQRIFEVFVRVHHPDEIPGTGIGLAFCKRIVEHHGGQIWVESQPGQGSTFYFSLPKTV